MHEVRVHNFFYVYCTHFAPYKLLRIFGWFVSVPDNDAFKVGHHIASMY